MQRLTSTLCTLTLSLALALPAAADLYRYRTPDGRLVFSNTPPPAGTDATTSAEGTGAMTTTTAEIPEALTRPLPEVTQAEPPPTTPPPAPAQAPATPDARPVDTLAYAHLRGGMSQLEVQRRLGPPAHVSQGNAARYGTVVEIWQYPGNRHLSAVRLMFRNGGLTGKTRE
jgi:hypothetical protein